jgi:5'-phosphate synthase pdxT subunit
MKVGVVAVQGDFEKHLASLRLVGATAREVRTPEDLADVDRVIIPGGESTTVGLLMERYGLGPALRERAAQGMPVWGTCMGMIMMAREIEGRSQYTLDLLDITIRRNAFGAQVHSFEDEVTVRDMETPVVGVFIRAPIVTRLGEGVEELARYEEKVVAVRRGNLIGTSFHPELTDDTRMHKWFLSLG